MLLDSTSSPQPERLKIMIKDKISKRFWQANYLKDVETMIRIFEIAEKINLDAIPTYTPEAIANLVADASYMLDSDQIKAAQSQLRWVLKLSSQNIQARLLLGSSYFASGNYTQAAQLLKEVSSPSNEMNQILAICYLRSGQGERALEVIQLLKSQSQTLSDRLLFEIGYYQALQKQWRSASDFFNSMNQKVPDVWIYLLACSYRLNDLKAVWQSYNQLPAAIRANRQITSLALRSAQTLGLAGMADSILEKSMSLISERTLITQAAQSFLEQEFAPFELDLSLVAAQYFQNEKSDPKRALSALDKKKSNKDWRISTERAKAFIQLGLYQDSLQEIEANKPQEITVESLNYWLTLSKAQRLCGQFDKSYQLIASVQSTVGLNRAIYFEKSQLFLLLMRPDLALSEIKNIIDENAVVEELMVYVECLIKSNLFEEALKYSETILQQDYSAAVTWKLAVLIWPAQVKLQKPVIAPSKNLFELLNADQKGLAIQHLINIRAFAQAQSWAEQFSNDLNQSFEGKFALLQLALMQRQNNRIPQLLQQLTDDQTTIEQHYRLLQWIEHLGQSEALEHLLKKSTDPLVALNNKDMAEMIKSFLSFLSSSAIKMDKRGILDEETTKILTVIRDQSFDHRQANGPLYFHWIHAYSCLLLAQPLRAEPDFELCTVASPAFTSAFLKLSHILLDAKHWDLAVEWAQKALLQF
jgi:thioredoxin-like negative regulator of GroEL